MASQKTFCIGSALFGVCTRARAHVHVRGSFLLLSVRWEIEVFIVAEDSGCD